jgi:flagellar basal body-associated protein FliL
MSKVKYIIFCFLFFILIKNTETIQPKENNDQNDFPEKDKRFPQRKPYKDKYIHNETNRFRQRGKFGKLIKESCNLKRQNKRLIIIIIILVGIILMVIGLYLFVIYYNKCSTESQKKFYDDLKKKINKIQIQNNKIESLKVKTIKNSEAPNSAFDSLKSSNDSSIKSSIYEKEDEIGKIIIYPNENDKELYKAYDDIKDDDNDKIE